VVLFIIEQTERVTENEGDIAVQIARRPDLIWIEDQLDTE
jgi:hypothetical protein